MQYYSVSYLYSIWTSVAKHSFDFFLKKSKLFNPVALILLQVREHHWLQFQRKLEFNRKLVVWLSRTGDWAGGSQRGSSCQPHKTVSHPTVVVRKRTAGMQNGSPLHLIDLCTNYLFLSLYFCSVNEFERNKVLIIIDIFRVDGNQDFVFSLACSRIEILPGSFYCKIKAAL